MKLVCPNCSQPIQADNINVQELVAVCDNCNTVFEFNPKSQKEKRRKTKQPIGLELAETERLEMAFRTNWRLDANQQFITTLLMGGNLAFISTFFFSAYLQGELPLLFALSFLAIALLTSYPVGLIVYNKTHITVEDDYIQVARKPLNNPLRQPKKISLHDIRDIKCEETAISVERNYDTPRYEVWAETYEGNRRPIVVDVVEEYAYFITQKLNEALHYQQDYDVSRLEDSLNNDSLMLDDISHSDKMNSVS